MTPGADQCPADRAIIQIACSADQLFDFMSDPQRLDLWSFGTWRTEISADGLVRGWSLFNGAQIYLRIETEPLAGRVHYLVGTQPDQLERRIFAQIQPASTSGQPAAELQLVAMRTAKMDDTRWADLKAIHAVEVRLIKQLIESGHDHRRPPVKGL